MLNGRKVILGILGDDSLGKDLTDLTFVNGNIVYIAEST